MVSIVFGLKHCFDVKFEKNNFDFFWRVILEGGKTYFLHSISSDDFCYLGLTTCVILIWWSHNFCCSDHSISADTPSPSQDLNPGCSETASDYAFWISVFISPIYVVFIFYRKILSKYWLNDRHLSSDLRKTLYMSKSNVFFCSIGHFLLLGFSIHCFVRSIISVIVP